MDYRSLVVVGVILGASVLPLLPACNAPDPGQITFVPRSGSSNPSDENGDESSSGNNPTTSTSSSGATDAGTATLTDEQKIFGTEAFTFNDPGETVNTQNIGTGATNHTAPMQGKECGTATCHGAGGGGPQWEAGGTVYADNQGTALASGTKIEMRIVDPQNNIIGGGSFCPDTDGNFWLDPGGTFAAIPDGSHVGVRKEGGTMKMMQTALTGGASASDCASAGCHGLTSNRIYAP